MTDSSQRQAEKTGDSRVYEDSGYKDVMEKADELQEDYYNQRTSQSSSDELPDLDFWTWITGLSKGEIIDVSLDEDDNIVLDVRLDNDTVSEVSVRNKDTKYTDDNELVRLLEYKNIPEGRIEQLLGKTVPLYIDRYSLPSNELETMDWKLYIPKKFNRIGILKHRLDTVLRYMGYEGEFQSKLTAIAFLGVSLFWWSLLFLGIYTGIVAVSNEANASITTGFAIVTLMSLLLTIYTPLIMRMVGLLREKFVQFRNRETAL